MSRRSRNNSRNNMQSQDAEQTLNSTVNDTNADKNTKSISDILKHPIVAAVIASVIVTGLSKVIAFSDGLSSIENNISAVQASVDGLRQETKEFKTDVNNNFTEIYSQMSNLDARIENVEKRIDTMDDRMFATRYQPTETAIESIATVSYNESKGILRESPSWNSDDIIATDSKTGESFTAEQLAGERLLLPYTSDGKEVYFFGQFNENNHWDGDCVINIYVENELILITNATYNDGNLINYEQVIPDSTVGGNDVWLVSERQHEEEGYNTGDTWSYFRYEGCQKDFELDDVDANDIINVRSFKANINTPLEGFYHGQTSDGYYNDDTGNAYLVKYTPDGTVRMLYSGKFDNGQLEDCTGNAWYIVRDEYDNYSYYKGIFNSGRRKNDIGLERKISIERIEDIIYGKFFNCKLEWYNSETDTIET